MSKKKKRAERRKKQRAKKRALKSNSWERSGLALPDDADLIEALSIGGYQIIDSEGEPRIVRPICADIDRLPERVRAEPNSTFIPSHTGLASGPALLEYFRELDLESLANQDTENVRTSAPSFETKTQTERDEAH